MTPAEQRVIDLKALDRADDARKEEKMTKHTAIPWQVAYGSIYTDDPRYLLENQIRIANMDRDEPDTAPTERDANAHFIVRAVNSHEDLLAACEAADVAAQVLFIAARAAKLDVSLEAKIALSDAARDFGNAWADVQAAIRKARGIP